MSIVDIIATKRDGRRHNAAEIQELINGAATGEIPDYQLSAWLMAAYLHPLDADETAWMTLAMARSGEILNLDGLPKPWVDKHSTGGVGDKTTIVLLPMLAACGLTVVKMSGRGLGITGGTIDKLESIPGFRTDLSPNELISQAKEIGLAITGQTPSLAPADKILYALRDVTATVDSIPLITSSILSKKIAGGAEIISLDVKCGSGAFMKTLPDAQKLAHSLMDTGKRCGVHVQVTITDMDQPLGECAGNAWEINEAMAVVRGEEKGRFRDLCVYLAAETLVAAHVSPDLESATLAAEKSLADGSALKKADQWFRAQGARDPNPAQDDGRWLSSLQGVSIQVGTINASEGGWVRRVDACAVGNAVLALGGGRSTKADTINPRVAVRTLVTVGQAIRIGEPLFSIHAASDLGLSRAIEMLSSAVDVSASPVAPNPLILDTFA